MAKTINYSDTEKQIVATLKANEDKAMTLAEISKEIDKELKSGNINALVKKGNVETVGDRVIVCKYCGAKKKVKEYKFLKDID